MALPYIGYHTIASIGPFTVTTWGFFVALGFLVGLYLIAKEAKRKDLDIDEAYNLALIVIIAGLIGARLGWFITEGLGTNFVEVLKIWNGGMIWSGGLIGAIIASFFYIRYKKLNFFKYADAFALGLPLGHAIGRLGCFFAGYHLGKVTTLPWGIMFEGQLRHPMPLYEIAFLVPFFIVLWRIRKDSKFDGWLFSIYLLGYSTVRFFLDFLRADPTYLGLTVAQYAALFIIAVTGAILYLRRK